MRKSSIIGWIVAVIVLLALIVGGIYLFRKGTHNNASTTASGAAAAASANSGSNNGSSIEHPISQAVAPTEAATAALPPLADSDASVATGIEGWAGGAGDVLIKQQIVNRIVATVDALPRASWGERMLPAHPPRGAFAVTQADGKTTIGADNAARYAPYVRMLEKVDPKTAVDWYVREYPLFQKAYQQLGYPKGYFNDRLIQAIDNLLAAPQPHGPVALTRPKVVYHYADPQLEALSSGQKLMLRMGPANEAKVKALLRALRARLTGAQLPVPVSAGTSAAQ